MQLHKVVGWLAQHNFPHGMVAFMDGLSADPLRQKAQYLKTLVKEVSATVAIDGITPSAISFPNFTV